MTLTELTDTIPLYLERLLIVHVFNLLLFCFVALMIHYALSARCATLHTPYPHSVDSVLRVTLSGYLCVAVVEGVGLSVREWALWLALGSAALIAVNLVFIGVGVSCIVLLRKALHQFAAQAGTSAQPSPLSQPTATSPQPKQPTSLAPAASRSSQPSPTQPTNKLDTTYIHSAVRTMIRWTSLLVLLSVPFCYLQTLTVAQALQAPWDSAMEMAGADRLSRVIGGVLSLVTMSMIAWYVAALYYLCVRHCFLPCLRLHLLNSILCFLFRYVTPASTDTTNTVASITPKPRAAALPAPVPTPSAAPTTAPAPAVTVTVQRP
jgi:hypothetical protein